jgi:hypothetical protein
MSVLESFDTLAAGATLCMASEDETRRLTIRALRVTHVFTPPALSSPLEGPAHVPSLRFLALLGDPTTPRLFYL